jgi:hypothetical protein
VRKGSPIIGSGQGAGGKIPAEMVFKSGEKKVDSLFNVSYQLAKKKQDLEINI